MNLVELNTDTTYFRTDKNSTHSYLPLYDDLLKPIKDTAINILEIGVRHGGSIKLWLDYFTKGTIYGCDIVGEGSERAEKLKLIGKNRVVLKLDEDAYTEQYVKTNFENKKFDFLLDDGPHTLDSQIKFIELYSPLLSENGILIIEDVADIKWLKRLKDKTPEHLKKYIKTYDLRKNKRRYDDIVFTIDKVVR
jgi:predicted O-methyltransferase YrrM